MSAGSKIQWTDDTWNWVIGCTKISPGCVNCYAEVSTPVRVARKNGVELWGPNGQRRRAADATFNAPLKWNEEPWVCDACGGTHHTPPAKCSPSRYCGINGCQSMSVHRRRVFSLSLGDWLEEKIPIETLADALDVIRRCPNLDFLLLTKRPENFGARLHSVFCHLTGPHVHCSGETEMWVRNWQRDGVAPQNVWIGTTVENQEYADKRIPKLLKIPAVCRFISYEPALEEVDFTEWLWKSGCIPHCGDKCSKDADCDFNPSNEIHQIIVGGESGPHARAFNIEWARSTVAQCKAAGVACFVKQLGAKPYDLEGEWNGRRSILKMFSHDFGDGELAGLVTLKDKKGGDMSEWPEDLRVRQFPTTLSSSPDPKPGSTNA